MKSIAYLEDEELNAAIVKLFLQDKYNVTTYATGEEFLAYLEDHQPDLLILDVMLPGKLDGLQVCQTLRTKDNFKETPIIIASARAQDEDVQLGIDAGANTYLIKPFMEEELLEAIVNLI